MPGTGGREIVVVGSVNVDFVFSLPRLPLKGETVSGGGFAIHYGGKGANQAVAVARLGITPAIVASVGDDSWGSSLVARLEEEGVDCRFMRRVAAPSGCAGVFVDPAGDNFIAVAGGANAYLTPSQVMGAGAFIRRAAVLMVQQEIPRETVKAALWEARQGGVVTILDPGPDELPGEILGLVDYITPNAVEAAGLTGVDVHCWSTAAKAARRLRQLGVKAALVTMGKGGAFYSGPKGDVRIAAPPVEAVDSTGAGDGFNGALAVALAKGVEPDLAADIAAAAGALATTRAGALNSFPREEELARVIGLPWLRP